MKALILAAGRGKRLGQTCENKNKCMLSINGKNLIEYSFDCALSVSVTEIVIVVGYQADEIIRFYGECYKGKNIKYVRQNEPGGLVNAIECARESVGQEDFMLMLGDELLIHPKHDAMIEKFRQQNLFAACGVIRVKDLNLIKKTYAVIQGVDERIVRLIEKPSKPWNDMMGTGNCLFRSQIWDYIGQTPINQKRGEKELPDLIQVAVDDGNVIKPVLICEQYVNVNNPEEIDRAESYFAHL
ncbi:MAG: sugar phosphate nucleotidyltransferase [Candidatus Omnitrophota bacterium]